MLIRQPRTRNALAAGLGIMGLLGACCVRANAQNEAPFTIRKPPDGATVREKVKIEIPLASIPDGGYVAFYIDGEFQVALTPTAAQREHAKPGENYVFTWDTKKPVKHRGSTTQAAPADGEHEGTANIIAPSVQTQASI